MIEHEGAVIGFNMLGSRWDHARFEDWINERRSLDYVMDNLHLAQFDVEFGRTDLALRAAASTSQGVGRSGGDCMIRKTTAARASRTTSRTAASAPGF